MKKGRVMARLARRGQTGYSQPIPKAGIGGSPRFAARTLIGIFERVALRGDLTRRDEKRAGNGEVSSAWANRVQPANSKGGNWWQSPLCGAHTDRHFRESRVKRRPHPAG